MKTVYLTSGPRGAGKTTFARDVVSKEPLVVLIERDEFTIREFGTTMFDPYDGTQYVAMEAFERYVDDVVEHADDDARIILDAWNGDAFARYLFVQRLRRLGVDRIICWYFVTPLDACIRWFLAKTDRGGCGEDSVRWDYELYHSSCEDIDYSEEVFRIHYDRKTDREQRGFDIVRRINPLQIVLPTMIAV